MAYFAILHLRPCFKDFKIRDFYSQLFQCFFQILLDFAMRRFYGTPDVFLQISSFINLSFRLENYCGLLELD